MVKPHSAITSNTTMSSEEIFFFRGLPTYIREYVREKCRRGRAEAILQWIIEVYLLFLSALILVGGSLGDQVGRKHIFALGTSIFILASVWCGLSPTILSLIFARAVQGIGGALLIPGSLALIGANFDEA